MPIERTSVGPAPRRRWPVARALLLAAVVTAALLAAGCGSSGGDDGSATATTTAQSGDGGDTPTVYMVGSVANNTFWAAVKRGFEQGGQDYGLRAVYSAPGVHSSSSAIPLVKSALAAKPAGIAINYTDKSLEQPVLDALGEGAKVVLFNNRLFQAVPGQPDTATTDPSITSLAYVGEDTELNAQDLAKEYVKHLKPGAKVVIVDPVPGVLTLVLRRRGLESVLKANGFSTDYLPAALDEGKNYATISSYMQGHPEVGGILGLGGPTGNPAAQWVKKTGSDVPVGSFDVDSATAQAIENGSMVAATDQQPYLQGYLSAMNLSLMIKKSLFPVTVNTGSYIVTKSNVSEVAKAVAQGTG